MPRKNTGLKLNALKRFCKDNLNQLLKYHFKSMKFKENEK